MIPKSVMDRLRKCLALSASANEHEAAAALNMARKIMEEHGITSADLALAEIEEAAARGSRNRRPSRWETYLCAAVRRAFAVEVFIDSNCDRRYVGRGPAPEVASYAFAVLFRQLKKARTEYIATTLRRCKPGRKRARAARFCEGWASSVYHKIAALAPKAEPDPLVGQYLAERHPDLVEFTPRAATASRTASDYWNGVATGRQAELHGGVGASARPLELEGQ